MDLKNLSVEERKLCEGERVYLFLRIFPELGSLASKFGWDLDWESSERFGSCFPKAKGWGPLEVLVEALEDPSFTKGSEASVRHFKRHVGKLYVAIAFSVLEREKEIVHSLFSESLDEDGEKIRNAQRKMWNSLRSLEEIHSIKKKRTLTFNDQRMAYENAKAMLLWERIIQKERLTSSSPK